MLKPNFKVLSSAILLVASAIAYGQDSDHSKAGSTEQNQESFLLTLTLKITDHGKVTTDQVYSLTAMNAGSMASGSIVPPGAFSSPSVRDGDKVPVVTGGEGDKTQIQYIDTGTNIDIESLQKIGSTLAMRIKIENSTALPNLVMKDDPIIRQTRYSIGPAVTIGKLSTIYASTDGVDGHKVEITLLAKPLDSK